MCNSYNLLFKSLKLKILKEIFELKFMSAPFLKINRFSFSEIYESSFNILVIEKVYVSLVIIKIYSS